MADQVSNYKCPNCGGPLRFDPASQKLKCEYCDSLFTQEEVEEFYRPSEEAAAALPWNRAERPMARPPKRPMPLLPWRRLTSREKR